MIDRDFKKGSNNAFFMMRCKGKGKIEEDLTKMKQISPKSNKALVVACSLKNK